jgi:cytochrome c-type biogenesis protein CcmE
MNAPAGGARPPRHRRFRPLVIGIVVAGAGALLAAKVLSGNLVYFRTPSELAASRPAVAERLRLGGMVVPDSIRRQPDSLVFTLTDGAAEVAVVYRGVPPALFRGNQGAVVEGAFDGTGVFQSDSVMIRHSNEYRGAGNSHRQVQTPAIGSP